MSNAFFYTMATIAASLGSAMALLAAFALYRLTAIASEIQYDSRRIAEGIGGADCGPMLFSASMGNWTRYLTLMNQAHARYNNPERNIDLTVQALIQRLRGNLLRSRRLLIALWVALILTGVVMTSAVVGLASADHLQPASRLGLGAPWLGVLGFVACLISYLVLIRLALRRA
jgi:hypothetical protein